MENKIIQPKPLSGYVEWLPEIRAVELVWLDTIRRVFESYGFANIETPSVEEIRVLAAKGEDADKEIYALKRLNAEEGQDEARVALHFDLTVPLARFVAQHYNDLTFPFKRYQIQRVWRGERPQEGRFREFYQCDIDVIDNEKVSLSFDAELPLVMADVVAQLGMGRAVTRISNRKIMEGFYAGLGLADIHAAIRVIDKLDKIGSEGVAKILSDTLGLGAHTIERILAFATIIAPDKAVIEQVRALGVTNELLDQGLDELGFVMEGLAHLPRGEVVADLSIARGFDYYTGTVYEGKFLDYPNFPTIYAGGRYDNLVGSYLRRALPGIGVSFGLTRIFAKLVKEGVIVPGAKSPSQILVAHPPEVGRAHVLETARTLRARGLRVETYHEPKKLDNQIKYATRKGIQFIWFPPAETGSPHLVKDLATGQQIQADPASWVM
jgi:histidyl-tRNA synthetase